MDRPKIIITGSPENQDIILPASEDFSSEKQAPRLNSLDELCQDTPFGKYMTERQHNFECAGDKYLMGELKRSFLKKEIPEKKNITLAGIFRRIENAYGVAVSDYILEWLFILLWLADLFSGTDVEGYQKGVIPRLADSNKLSKKISSKRNAADLRSFNKKRIQREQKKFKDAFGLVMDRMREVLDRTQRVFLLKKYNEVISNEEKIMQETDRYLKINGPFARELERPLKAFVCRTLNRIKTSKKKSTITPVLTVMNILNNAVILNPNNQKPFTDTDIRSRARGCQEYL